MKVYLLVGETGIYDGYCKWNVAAYVYKESAEEEMDFLNNMLKTYKCHEDTLGVSNMTHEEREEVIKKIQPFDKKIDIAYTGSSYRLEEINLIGG